VELVEVGIGSEEAYHGGFLRVQRDQVRLPDGSLSTREFIVYPGAAMVIPVTAGGRLVMVRQFRYPVKEICIEFPAGKIDSGESTLKTAQRELLEETGFVAAHYEHLLTFHPNVGYADEKIAIYLATGLTPGPQKLDHGEFVEVFEIDFSEAMAKLLRGEITDSKTIVGLFWYQQKLAAAKA
jgi:ADP-ribose pyrophosphatase